MDDSFTISISTKLIDQLSGDEGKPKKLKPKVPREAHQVQSKAESNGSSKTASNIGWPQQHPLFVPISPPPQPVANAELEAFRSVVQESEKAVERLQKKEAEMVQELTERAKELREKEFKLPYQKPMPCLAEKNACLECYKENAKNPLRCAHAVAAFNDCARKARQQMNSYSGE
uniref:Coiled-coil-helix-coiled-coil-helix domain-containing protein 3, mitochondrial n=1 Tax=Anthurium amnicola TaxID=1678845 RepID=A0A1D1Z8R7_9ARAE